ncbi:MAG: hypothetical protein IIA33_09465, partial [Planctomycetes bacterium]|nr:hypothetical protein [Planctomycetota bacterium]
MRISILANGRFVLQGAALFAVVVLAVCPRAAAQAPMGTVFTYQGELTSGGVPVDEPLDGCDFEFTLWDADVDGSQVGPTLTPNALVADGRFTVALDFGPDIFIGDARFMEIAVCCPSPCVKFTTLSPRQELTPAPHALALPGLYTQQTVTSPNLIGGFTANLVTPGVIGATIGGGGQTDSPNLITGNYGSIGGGSSNTAGSNATVGGGSSNTANAGSSTIGGGVHNTTSGSGFSTIGGGSGNTSSEQGCTIGGGELNTANALRSTVGGGRGNTAS